MAHLIRPWQVRYIDKAGKRCASTVPGAKKVRQRARKFYGAGIPGMAPDGRPYGDRRVPLAANREVARQMLAALVLASERGEVRLEDRTTEAGKTPLATHLADFAAWMRSRPDDVSEKQIGQTLHRVRSVFDACNFQYPGEIDADAVAAYLADRRRLPKRNGGLSIQSSNHYATAVSTFCRWMSDPRRRRMPSNPMGGAGRGNVKLDRRHDRRDLSADELQRLFDATLATNAFSCDLSPADRHWLYRIAAYTGFRRSELASLTPDSFDLAAPTVAVEAGYTKNRQPAKQPLPAALAASLAPWLSEKPAGQLLWPGVKWQNQSARMIRKDLEAAGIPYEVKGAAGSQFADFHSLRHTFITMLARNGVHPKEAQALARHSTISLTMDRYTHADASALAEAVVRLDGAAETLTAAQLATGFLLFGAVLNVLLGPPEAAVEEIVTVPVAPVEVQPKAGKRQKPTA
jgi:integrase